MLKRNLLLLIIFCLCGVLTACNTIDHQSDQIAKKPLPPLKKAENLENATVLDTTPRILWASHHGVGTNKRYVKLQLAISGDLLISADSNGQLFAQDRHTGKLHWQSKSTDPITSGPTIVQDKVIVGTQTGLVLAHDLNTGNEIWRSTVSGEILAAPQGGRGMVFVHSLDGTLTALNLNTGKSAWKFSLNTPSIVSRQSSSPVLFGDKVVIGFANGRLLALNSREGSIHWEKELAYPKGRSDIQRMADISSDPVIAGGKIYATSAQGRLAALNLEGNSIWEREVNSFSGLSIAKNLLLVSDTKGHILALDRDNGQTRWAQSDLEGRHFTKPVVYKDTLVVADEEGYLHWLSLETGALLNRDKLDKQGVDAVPRLVDDTLYVLGKSGKITAYDLKQTQ